jgi:hypothetical protein
MLQGETISASLEEMALSNGKPINFAHLFWETSRLCLNLTATTLLNGQLWEFLPYP